ncbi:putative DNA polymerase sliding clamp [Stenotrophomonas phage Mendera]|uniref:Sliding clamp n=2 Tax=Menderavirus TaxID=2843421 RepID=A0A5P8PIS0_9CAUD|nr:DNA polymerase processivity factor [Stenotrophomonas phage Mendera]YP_010667603.1 sliding clamp DNA polymerase accessory protein [Stenotrophomonas maltophilia phage vB_SmaM_Ps15]QFR56574.1 putative DNA polymerase sliding clamp [Stenotrophomonas phage Mendera]UMO77275.1 sliding clamp DNA polymerase accessory protein [Stenotrophomonas maltophilia phage vB_SmaM_Ps15]
MLQNATIETLENFASINKGLVFKPGNRLRTVSILKNVFAVAEVPDTFDREFAIYDLNEFLAVLSLLNKPALDFKEEYVLITDGKSKIKYFYSSPAVVQAPPDKDIVLTDPELTLTLTKDDLTRISKASAALKLTVLSLSQGKVVAADPTASSKDGSNSLNIEVETSGESDNVRAIKIENMKMIPGDYSVSVFERAVEFKNKEREGLVYIVAVEQEKK